MPYTTAIATAAFALAGFNSPGTLAPDQAPTVRGANAAPNFIVHAKPTVWLTGICPDDAAPSDVTITDDRGRQYRTRSNGQRWIDREGVTIARRNGDRVSVYLPRRSGFVAAWCEQD